LEDKASDLFVGSYLIVELSSELLDSLPSGFQAKSFALCNLRVGHDEGYQPIGSTYHQTFCNEREAIDFFPKRRKFKELQDTLIFFTNNEFVADLYIKINYSPKMQLKLGMDESYSKIGLGTRLKSNKNMSNFIKFRLCS